MKLVVHACELVVGDILPIVGAEAREILGVDHAVVSSVVPDPWSPSHLLVTAGPLGTRIVKPDEKFTVERSDDCDCTICAYSKRHPQLGAARCWEQKDWRP